MVFYTFLDKCNLEYFLLNDSISQVQYPLYFLTSNVDEEVIREKFPSAHVLITDNNMQWKFINFVRKTNAKFIVKIDLDAIIFNYPLLLKKISQIKEGEILGNLKGTKQRCWIRGGCNAIWSQDLVNLIPESSGNYMDVDIWLSKGLKLKKVDCHLFEQSTKWSGTEPVWHPPQSKDKMKCFKEELEKWKKGV